MILGQVRWIRYFLTVPKQTERTGLIPFALFPDTVWIKKSNPKVPCHGIRTTLNTLVSFLNIQRITRDVNMKFTAYQNKRTNSKTDLFAHLFGQFVNCIQHIIIV